MNDMNRDISNDIAELLYSTSEDIKNHKSEKSNKQKKIDLAASKKILNYKGNSKRNKFRLYSDGIKKHPLYKKRGNNKSEIAESILEQNCDKIVPKNIIPGKVIYFKYLNPIYKEELEYYDASPMVIYFGKCKNKEGHVRVLGFNLHYYPPGARYKIINKIYEMFKPTFMKFWETGSRGKVKLFNYKYIMNVLTKVGLDFGVRMYDPKLMSQPYQVSTRWLSTCVFTEGKFKKQTRVAIMNYWRNWVKKQ